MKKILIYIFVLIILICGCFYAFNSDDKNFQNKTIKYNGNNLMISIDGASSTKLPTSGNYYLASYECKSSNTILEWDRVNYKLNVTNSNKKGGVACYLDFQSNPKLSDMEVGSYVSYTGNNGCSGNSCSGQNANYVSDTDMGYCNHSINKFTSNGWRIGYIENNSAYLISAGSTDCMCTASDGTTLSTTCSSYLSSTDLYKHLDNLDSLAIKYCNGDYVYGGTCNNTTTWAMNSTDFEKITGSALNSSSCFEKYSDRSCGYANDLIDNGSYYWVSTVYSSSAQSVFNWSPTYFGIYHGNSSYATGLRPVIYLDSNVVVTGGSGTYDDPYTIGNNTFSISEESTVSDGSNSLTLNLMSVGATQMCISTDTSVCTDYIDFSDTYTLDISSLGTGEHVIYVYYKNSKGNITASMNRAITLS